MERDARGSRFLCNGTLVQFPHSEPNTGSEPKCEPKQEVIGIQNSVLEGFNM